MSEQLGEPRLSNKRLSIRWGDVACESLFLNLFLSPTVLGNISDAVVNLSLVQRKLMI